MALPPTRRERKEILPLQATEQREERLKRKETETVV